MFDQIIDHWLLIDYHRVNKHSYGKLPFIVVLFAKCGTALTAWKLAKMQETRSTPQIVFLKTAGFTMQNGDFRYVSHYRRVLLVTLRYDRDDYWHDDILNIWKIKHVPTNNQWVSTCIWMMMGLFIRGWHYWLLIDYSILLFLINCLIINYFLNLFIIVGHSLDLEKNDLPPAPAAQTLRLRAAVVSFWLRHAGNGCWGLLKRCLNEAMKRIETRGSMGLKLIYDGQFCWWCK